MQGRWLLRIEDLDPAREPSGAAADIIDCLAAHGLQHDGKVTYQSTRHSHYEAALAQLRHSNRLYACQCTRAQLRQQAEQTGSHAYAGTCRTADLSDAHCALRLRLHDNCQHSFHDRQLGPQSEDLRETCGDFVLRRRDGLYAYQLAVVVDDAAQGITEIVRGADLLDNTARQIHLQQALGLPQPAYRHIPVLLDGNGLKLSKQNHAPALDNSQALQNLQSAWATLAQSPIGQATSCQEFLATAIQAWQPERIPHKS